LRDGRCGQRQRRQNRRAHAQDVSSFHLHDT
jgi:hypothetical protein